jgi:hypothetical protein
MCREVSDSLRRTQGNNGLCCQSHTVSPRRPTATAVHRHVRHTNAGATLPRAQLTAHRRRSMAGAGASPSRGSAAPLRREPRSAKSSSSELLRRAPQGRWARHGQKAARTQSTACTAARAWLAAAASDPGRAGQARCCLPLRMVVVVLLSVLRRPSHPSAAQPVSPPPPPLPSPPSAPPPGGAGWRTRQPLGW